jgi:hypothetical protein
MSPRPISLMPVDRWAFWAGVLVLVVWLPLQLFVAPALDHPIGTSYSFTSLVILSVILLLASVYIGGGAKAQPRSAPPPAPSASGPETR